jgi:seryl-tRNA synthetase
MHDPRVLLDPTTDAVRRLARRGYALDLTALEKLLAARNAAIHRGDEARAESKRTATSVRSASPDERPVLVERARELKSVVADAEAEARELDAQLQDLLLGIPNLPADDVPDGSSEDDAELVRSWGEPVAYDFTPRDHVDLGERLRILDLPRATKLSGPRFAVLRGQGAKLERALARYFLDLAEEHGYTEFSVPTLVNRETMTGTGQLPKFEEDLFKTTNEPPLYLIPTAEVPVTNMHRDEIFEADALPISYCAFSPCFRAEAGSAGRDTRGIMRQHQFHKVELVKFAKAEESYAEHERMLDDACEVLRRLGLHHRVSLLCTGDMGFSSAKTYDIEVWCPGQDAFREISSVSNCEDFQARRIRVRYRGEGGKPRLAHTLNGSGVAVGRTLVAILEQYQEADGTVTVPEALRPYLGGLEKIVATKFPRGVER